MRSLTIGLVLIGLLAGCSSDAPGNVGLVNLRVFQVAFDEAERDPYQNVRFMRLIAASNDAVLTDKFVNYEQGVPAELGDIPFGENVQITIEGWSRNSQTGTIGQVVSRGRSKPLDLAEDGEPVDLNIPFARVNAFARTSQPGTAGASATGLAQGRVGHSVTVMADGRVLVAGGYIPVQGKTGDFTGPSDVHQVLTSAEIYDPDTGAFSPVTATMNSPRAFHTAILLDNQAVLFIGGLRSATEATATVEAYDPLQNIFISLGSVPLKTGRYAHTTTQLDNNGYLLIAGGFSLAGATPTALGSAEVLCVPTFPCVQQSGEGVIPNVFNMQQARGFHTATRVDVGQNGQTQAVVMIGGEGDDGPRSTLETFTLDSPGFVPVAPAEMVGGPRTRHTANYIHSQRFIHVVGGFSDKAHATPVQRIDSYQVQQQAFHTGKDFYALAARGGHGSANIANNAILLFGGFDANGPMATAEVIFEYHDPEQQKTFIDRGGVGDMHAARGGGVGAALPNGTVLITGGLSAGGELNRIGEFFNPL